VRPLDEIYAALFIDAIVVKVRDGQVANRLFIPFFDYDIEIRTVLCSTNAIGGWSWRGCSSLECGACRCAGRTDGHVELGCWDEAPTL
jgi:hypothetical protein